MAVLVGQPSFAQYEPARSFTANAVLPSDLLSGPHHRIAEQVTNDGVLNLYQLETAYGRFPIRGTDLLRLRIRELDALAKINQIPISNTYLKAASASAIAPARGAYRMIREPRKSVRSAANGVGRLFGRVGGVLSGKRQGRGHSPNGIVSRASGFSAAKRKIAVQNGVDPYTRFEPLKVRLAQLARASTAGQLTTRVGYSFVTGPASIAISVGRGVDRFTGDLATKSVRELNRLNRAALVQMRVEKSISDSFLANPNLSPTDKRIIVTSLESLAGAVQRDVFVAYAARVQKPYEAFSVRRQAELIAAYNTRVQPVFGFRQLGDIPAIAVKSRKLVVLLPADYLAWTAASSARLSAMISARRSLSPRPPAELVLTGVASRKTVSMFRKAGWRVRQKVDL